ncbi:MAG: hypothetical protein Q8R76_04290 [Candidatus Omnitrophota bacterium]|nr:hypothetical protein [Candidatus Omnitrophota bacterium]
MSKVQHRSKLIVLTLAVFFASSALGAHFAQAANGKKAQHGLLRDGFDQNFYYEGTNFLHLERLYRALFNKKARARDVNVYDEVPDSRFFQNRHARKRFSLSELERGYRESEGPDASGKLLVTSGKLEGLHPGFFVQDVRGDRYLFKFDPVSNFELATAAEVIASRFYYAIGYNVPQYTIVTFKPEKLEPAPGARAYDDTGFKRPLTAEKLEESVLFLPQDAQGRFRASASKILRGEIFGNVPFQGYDADNPRGHVPQQDMRAMRAVCVFASWLNNYDVRESNSLNVLQGNNEDDPATPYLIDFNSALGASAAGSKPPMYGYEHMFDFGESSKSFLSLGLWEKPWQRKWRQAGGRPHPSEAIGYFNNIDFDPGRYKTQFPYFAFKDLSLADAFWAAKIVMSFSDDDVRAMVKAGELTNDEDVDYIAKTLIERRDIIGKYWFDKANPLDHFDVKGGQLVFQDLAVERGFHPRDGNVYRYEVIESDANGRGKKIASLDSKDSALTLDSAWRADSSNLDILIRVGRQNSSSPGPYVRVELGSGQIKSITHED